VRPLDQLRHPPQGARGRAAVRWSKVKLSQTICRPTTGLDLHRPGLDPAVTQDGALGQVDDAFS